MLKRIFTLTFALILSHIAYAAESTPSLEFMQNTLVKAFPEIKVEHIAPTPIPDLFEVTSGANVFYVTAKGDYLLYGELLAIKDTEVTNLTEATRQVFVKKSLDALDPKTFIVFPATTDKVKATVTIGTDVDCGYCQKLHQEIPALNAAGITVRYLAFPRTAPGTPSYQKSATIWCASDPKQAIDDAFKGKEVTGPFDCKHPLDEHLAFVRSIGVSATPVIILENGMVLPGYMPASELIKIVDAQ